MNETKQPTAPTTQLPLLLGRCYLTSGARAAVDTSGDRPHSFLARHQRGDWGNLDSEDRHANNMALMRGGRILSSYRTSQGDELWIITEANRKVTTILLPEEY